MKQREWLCPCKTLRWLFHKLSRVDIASLSPSNRYTIKGIRNLIFYELPTYPHFYSDVCNMLQATTRGEEAAWTCTVLYSKYDAQRLAAAVGVERAAHMLQSKKNVHLFITGERWELVGQEMVFGVICHAWFFVTWTWFWSLTQRRAATRKEHQAGSYQILPSFQIIYTWKVQCKPDFGKTHLSEVRGELMGLWEVDRRNLLLVNFVVRHKFFCCDFTSNLLHWVNSFRFACFYLTPS